jgi:hypothetical protein
MAFKQVFKESRRALLERRTRKHQRSPGEGSQSSSEDELELDEPDYLKVDSYQAAQNSSWLGVVRTCKRPGGTCVVITAILLGGLILLFAVGSLWVYKSAPKDGVCQPSCSKLLSLTGCALGIASVVPITARRHNRLVGTQLSKGGGIGQEDEPCRES